MCAQYEAGGVQIKRKGQVDFNVRNKAKSLLCSELAFKDLIDTGLKFDAKSVGLFPNEAFENQVEDPITYSNHHSPNISQTGSILPIRRNQVS